MGEPAFVVYQFADNMNLPYDNKQIEKIPLRLGEHKTISFLRTAVLKY